MARGLGGALLLEADVDIAEFAQCAMSADFGGADGAFEDAGDLGEGEFLEAGEKKDFAIVAVEAGEGGVEEGVVVAGGGMVAGVGALVGVFLEIGGISGVGRGVGLAEVVSGAATGEVIHPGAETAVVAVGVAVFEHPLEDGLCDVLGRRALTGEFNEKAEERAVVAFEEFPERVQFAIADGEHQDVVGALFGGGVHGGRVRVFNHGWRRMNTDFWKGGNHSSGGTWQVGAGENRAAA